MRIDLGALIGGLAVAALGGLLLADAAEGLHITFGWLAPALLAAAGLVLVGARRR